jgi:hypothetical protein
VLASLERQGRDLSGILQNTDLPEEFLRDPSSCVEAPKMEAILRDIDSTFRDLPEDYARDIGRNSEQLRCWGVLDSVLKMVESPLDIYGQPSRFISYFISPEPPIAGLKQDNTKITFQLPVSAEQYPFITQYLSGALEGLPNYMRQPPAHVTWNESGLRIDWNQSQESLLTDEDLQLRQFNPQWVRTMMDSLEQHQKSFEAKAPQSEGVSVPLAELRELQAFLGESADKFEKVYADIMTTKNDFLKLHDYFVRSQQLITFLVHAGRKTKQVDEAMRRMDWSHVQSAYDEMVEAACDRILQSKDTVQGLLTGMRAYKAPESPSPIEEDKDLQLPIQ